MQIRLLIILIVLAFFPFLGHLDTIPLYLWDESIYAVNALEAYFNNNLLVTHFDGKPDMWNTKPPLMLWFQYLIMHLHEPSILALRLPSAIAGFSSTILIYLFFTYFIKNKTLGFISSMVLICSVGFVNYHGTRTGDYDALLSLFNNLYIFLFFIFIETEKKKYLYLFFITLAMAVLSKSIAALITLPILPVYLIYRKKTTLILKNKHFYFGLFISLTIVLAYYLGREFYNPGYLKAVYKNELGGRYLKVLEGHDHSNWIFIKNLYNKKYTYWIFLLLIGIPIALTSKEKKIKELTKYLFAICVFYFLIISFSTTKLAWYDLPMYPIMSIFTGVSIYTFYNKLKLFKPVLLKKSVPILFLLLLFWKPYSSIFNKTNKPQQTHLISPEGFYLNKVLKNKEKIFENTFLIVNRFDADMKTYALLINNKFNKNIKTKKYKNIQVNDTILVKDKTIMTYIEQNFNYTILIKKRVHILKINSRKN